jgi:hypothetical protein
MKKKEQLAREYVSANLSWDQCESDNWETYAENTFIFGYEDGYKQCRAEVKEQIEAVIVELGKIRKDHAGLGIVKVLLRGIG